MASPLNCRMTFTKFLEHFLLLYLLLLCPKITADDGQNGFHGEERDALLALVAGFSNSFLHHNWTKVMCYENDPPYWFGIECLNGRVTGVRLENLGLTGEIKVDSLLNLTELSILSFKDNSISGPLMDFSNNQKLTDTDLSGNRFDGAIPLSLLKLNSLASLQLQANNLSGSIPSFDQTSLREFNVSYNNLSGPIPNTKVLQSFNRFSYFGNPNLCGPPSSSDCNSKNDTSDTNKSKSSKSSKLVPILLVVNVVALIILLFLCIIFFKKYKNLKKKLEEKHVLVGDEEKDEKVKMETGGNRVAADEVEKGKLVFVNEDRKFELDDLLKASAEGLGKGNFGNCYKTMLERGPIVVKRLKDLKPLSGEEFMKQVRLIADQKHPNLLSLLAYYYSKDEKLLLYKFASNGNVYNRLNEGKGKPTRIPFRWSSRLSVARGVARALEYLHLNTKSTNVVPHGNLKLSNVLLDENDGVLVTDYGLTSLVAAPLAAQRMIAFKSPEYQSHKKVSRKSDVWSYGCLLLELVTGRVSADSAPPGTNAVDLCRWVHRAVREEWTAEIFDVEIAVQRSANHGMLKLLQIAMRCCASSPENRPEMSEVAREVENIVVTADSEDEEEFSSMDRSLTDESMSTPSRSTTTLDDRR
ncbi:pollen receptor-like kinase 1 [Coffea arabica]|uniref:Pollen receptor-like kinase 1 n=1 Tax=Coffea arabica TaxID=13443 RepID=A0ABM4X0F3_COFAR